MINFYRNYPYQNTSSQNNWSYTQKNSQPITLQKHPTFSPTPISPSRTKNHSSFSASYTVQTKTLSPSSSGILSSPPPHVKPIQRKKLPVKKEKKKFDFKCFKKDTCSSLNDVECFLNNFSTFLKYIKLINLLK